MPQLRVSPFLLASFAALTSACVGPTTPPGGGEPFSFNVDGAAVKPQSETIGNRGGAPRPVAAYADAKGVKTEFISNEIVIWPKSQAELDAFVARYQGVILGSNAVPEPPASLGITMDPKYKVATHYTVRVHSETFPTTNFIDEGQLKGMSGNYVISSDAGAQLLALSAHEKIGGLKVGPNFVYRGDSLGQKLFLTAESPTNLGFLDALQITAFRGPLTGGGSGSTVAQAWQFLSEHGYAPHSVQLAVIDGGFWLTPQGTPQQTGLGSDLPPHPVQYDFNDDDYIADGANLATCTGGKTCNWHGNGSVGTAAGLINNHAGSAGTGGLVANPWLFKVDMTFDESDRAIRTLVPWGAQVASMSYGGACNSDCVDYKQDNDYFVHFQEAIDAGIVMVAAAGNDGLDASPLGQNYYPCQVQGVICVGALEDGVNTSKSYSNYGFGVDVWAPTDIPVMPNGDNTINLGTHTGTSAATPFVAGVAAMLKSLNPSLTSDQVLAVFKSTGRADSLDPKVTLYLNARRAVEAVANGKIDADGFEPNNTSATATLLTPDAFFQNLTLDTVDDKDYYRFTLNDYSTMSFYLNYMQTLSTIMVNVMPMNAQGAPGGVVDSLGTSGSSYTAQLMPPGDYRILLTGTSDPQLYDLTFKAGVVGLQPDVFETNNTFVDAKSVAAGSYDVNLHVASDVDYYKFTTSNNINSPLGTNQFTIDSSDFPVNVDIYNAGGVLLSAAADFTSPYIFPSPNTTYVIKVTGTKKTRYSFTAGFAVDNSLVNGFSPSDKFWWLDPAGPVEGYLVGEETWNIFAAGARTQEVILAGAGLHVELLNVNAGLVASGQQTTLASATGGPGTAGETIMLQGTSLVTAGQLYVLHITRTSLNNIPADGTPGTLPQLAYTISCGAVQ